MATARPARMPLPHLRAWRLRRGYSQHELAQRAGMSKTTIVNLEGGKGCANFVSIRKLAAALALTREQLLFERPDTSQTPHGAYNAARMAR